MTISPTANSVHLSEVVIWSTIANLERDVVSNLIGTMPNTSAASALSSCFFTGSLSMPSGNSGASDSTISKE